MATPGPYRRRGQRRRRHAPTLARPHSVLRPVPGRRSRAVATALSSHPRSQAARRRVHATGQRVASAARTVNAAIAAPAQRRSVHAFRQRPLVYSAMLVYAVASIALMATRQVGITSEHAVLLCLVAFALVGRARPFVWDWLPFIFVAVMFEDLTGVGERLAGAVHTVGPIVFEKTLLGGAVATNWLQDRLGHGTFQHIFETGLVAEYLFHFAAPLVAGLWLWFRHREWFSTFVSAYVLVMAVGFIIYLIFPEMPPWLAARDGLIPHVQRMVVDTLQRVGGFGQFYAGADPEPNAAMPSLHVAVPMVIACTVVAVRGTRRSWLWMLYPLTLSFGVLYLGEHYLADTVVGVVLGALCFWVAIWTRNWGRGAVPAAAKRVVATATSSSASGREAHA
jgi:membrane-associated phospholipid phosphatase